jgi:pyridoxine kinase
VTFSNHPAHGSFRGSSNPAREIDELVQGLHERGLFSACDGLLSGYLGTAEAGAAILNAAALVRDASPASLWCCDPVMGDNGTFYVNDDIPEFFRDRAVPTADIVVPNIFEAGYLAGQAVETHADAERAAAELLGKGPKTVIITGIKKDKSIGALLATANGMWLCMAPVVDIPASGAGDVFAALYIGHYLKSYDEIEALAQAVTGVHTVLRATAEVQTIDLQLVAALPALDNLTTFPVEKIR